MTVDTKAANYQGLFDSKVAAEHAAAQLQAAGRETRVEPSILHSGHWIVYVRPSYPRTPEDHNHD